MIISDKLSKLILTQAQTNAEMNFNFFYFHRKFSIFYSYFFTFFTKISSISCLCRVVDDVSSQTVNFGHVHLRYHFHHSLYVSNDPTLYGVLVALLVWGVLEREVSQSNDLSMVMRCHLWKFNKLRKFYESIPHL